MSDRLERVKEGMAHELGLTDDWMDGTYLYYLTRAKSAFSVGTMTLDDFTEIDEQLLGDLISVVKPHIEQLEQENQRLKQQIARNID